MSNNRTWTADHNDGSRVTIAPKDSRGLRMLRDCGYRWLNRGNGFEQISDALIDREAVKELVAK